MIWIYAVEGKDFVAIDVTSLTQLRDIASTKWVWVDVFHPNEKELEILAELLGNEPELVEKFKDLMDNPLDVNVDGFEFCNYEKVHEFSTVVIPSIDVVIN